MELLRVLLPSAKPWSEKKHFAMVIVVGVSIFPGSLVLRVVRITTYTLDGHGGGVNISGFSRSESSKDYDLYFGWSDEKMYCSELS
jgi:hypothetical protein